MARVLIQESRYIILDEPTNHLDISYQYQIMDILKKQEATVFSSVHDLNLAALYCDRILFYVSGEDRGRRNSGRGSHFREPLEVFSDQGSDFP